MTKRRTTNGPRRIAAGLLLLLGLAACRSSAGTAQNTYEGREGDPEADVVRGNPALLKKLEMTNVRSRRQEGRLHVEFELHNKRQSNLAFEWSIDWYDDAGFQVDGLQSWTPISLGGKEYETLAITGPTPQASMWRLGVRTPNVIR